MVENPELYAAIVANPCEDTPRLAYADWLDENGYPERARFIRLQYEIEKLPPVGPKASKAKKEEAALLDKYGAAWAGEVARLVTAHRFRRGFVESVTVTADSFLADGERLFELAPVREVRFNTLGPRMPELAASPLLGRAEALGFSSYIMAQLHYAGRLEALLASPHLATVRRLDFAMQSLDSDDLRLIAGCPNLGAVAHLDLSSNPFDDAGLRAITHSDRLPALRSLNLWGGGSWVSLDGVRGLLVSPLADRLEHLTVAWKQFGDPLAKAVARSALTGVRTLDLSDNDITDAGAAALADSPHLSNLERLTLRGHRKTLTAVGRERLKKRFGKDVCVF